MEKRLLSHCILLSLSISAAYAQENQTHCANHDANCQAREKTINQSISLAPISVTANRMNTPVATYAGQISVLRSEDLYGNSNVIENMTQIPGFETGDDYGRQSGSQFKIRGFGYQSENRVIIEQDGVRRSPSLFSNHISSFRVDNNLLKEVEIVKGGSSVLHGSGAIGGIVSMRTKDATDFIPEGENLGFTIGGRIDSNNSKNAYFAFAADLENAPIDILAYGRSGHYGNIKLADGGVGDIRHAGNKEDIHNGMVKLGWDINPEQRLVLSHYQFNQKMTTTWQTLWHIDPGTNPVHGKLKQSDTMLSYQYMPLNNDWIDLEAKLYKSDASYYRTRDGSNPIQYRNEDERWGLSLKNQSNFNFANINNHLVIGLDYENREENAMMNSNGVISDFGSMPNYYRDLGVYAQNTFDFGKIDLTLGARYDYFTRGVDKAGAKEYSDGRLSPKIALSYEPVEGIFLLANYAETFRGPTPHETSSDGALNPRFWYVPNMDLKPETAKEYEIGFAIDKSNLLGDDDLYVKATYFNGKIENMINLQAATELGTPPNIGDGYHHLRRYGQYRNINEAKRHGYEIEAKYRFENWNFSTGFEHLKITNAATGARVQPSVDKLYANIGYSHPETGLSGGIKLTHWYHPKRDSYSFVNAGKTYHYINEPFTITDVHASWNPVNTGIAFFDQDFKLNLGINNIFDDRRINYTNTTETTAVGKGRNYYLNFEKRF